MGVLGDKLREARKGKGWSLAQAEGAIRIRQQYLIALEKEHFAEFASEAQIRGFLRAYSLALGLDPEEILELYDAEPRKVSHRPGIPRPRSLSPWSVMNLFILVVILIIIGIMGAHVASRQATPLATPTPTTAPVVRTRTVPRYVLEADLDYGGRVIQATQQLDYVNSTGDTIEELVFNVFPNHTEGIFLLKSLSVEQPEKDEAAPQLEYALNGTNLRVSLPSPLEPQEEVTLFLEFSLNLPRMSPYLEWSNGSLGYSDRVVAVGNWYPILVPYKEGQGWSAYPYHVIGDPYVSEVADYEVQIVAPSAVVIAGSGQEQRVGNRWIYSISQARSFAFAASDQYALSTQQAGNVTVLSYHFPFHERSGADALLAASEALSLFQELFGPYPYSTYRMAEVDFPGVLEYSALSFLGDDWYDDHPGGYRSRMTSQVVRQTAHQWWYGVVGNDQAREPWLDEALATYSSLLYYERLHPDLVEWWWETEVESYRPQGQIDRPIYAFMDGRSYLNAVYRRGALFMRDLRERMGEDEFFAFLRDYYDSQGQKLSTAQHFFSILSRHTAVDTSLLVEEYFGP